jgi:hypothetical protein
MNAGYGSFGGPLAQPEMTIDARINAKRRLNRDSIVVYSAGKKKAAQKLGGILSRRCIGLASDRIRII